MARRRCRLSTMASSTSLSMHSMGSRITPLRTRCPEATRASSSRCSTLGSNSNSTDDHSSRWATKSRSRRRTTESSAVASRSVWSCKDVGVVEKIYTHTTLGCDGKTTRIDTRILARFGMIFVFCAMYVDRAMAIGVHMLDTYVNVCSLGNDHFTFISTARTTSAPQAPRQLDSHLQPLPTQQACPCSPDHHQHSARSCCPLCPTL